MKKVEFTEQFKLRTKKFILDIIEFCKLIQPCQESLIIQNQLIKSAASVASNYRAACRARSRAEFYSKISIVVEEADESLFWIELVDALKLVSSEQIDPLKKEATEILSITARARKTTQINKPGEINTS